MDNKRYIAVGYEKVDEKQVMFTINQFPERNHEDIEHMAIVLCGGLSLLIKCANKEGKIKDYELMEKVIGILQSEFVNNNSFKDAIIHDNFKKHETE